MKSSRVRLVAIATLLLASACMTWSRSEPPGAALSHVDRKPIQVARTDHSTIVLKNASVQGDSLVGTADDGSNTRVAIPIAEIRGVSEEHIDGPRTLALTGGIILSTFGALLVAVIIIANTSKSPLL